MMRPILLLLASFCAAFSGTVHAGEQGLTLAVAANLKDAMSDLVADFTKTRPGAEVSVVPGSSGKFTHQIVNGAPYDLFFSADMEYPRKLQAENLAASAVRPYARGRLVLWSATLDARRLTLDSLAGAGIRKIAIANPKHAPYGARAREALERAGVWSKVQNRLVYGENVSQAAQFTHSGAADVAIIALSQALSPELKARGGYYEIPDRLHAPLDQGFVVLKRAAGNPLAAAFADYVLSPPARAILKTHGYTAPAAP